MKHEICDQCETVQHCSQHGCIPLQPQSQSLKPCRSPYCECTPGQCLHPGCYDARGEPWPQPPAQPTPVDWREAVLDLIDECPGLTMDQDRWLTQRIKQIANPPVAQPAPASWTEMVTANLVREGVNKHKARELAEHFYGLAPTEQITDPCPGCTPGHVCRTPACGRLQLPQNHPLRNTP
jgi:hypothetical protein